VRMEGWRQRRLGWAEKCVERKKVVEKSKKLLTGIGLLMEGVGSFDQQSPSLDRGELNASSMLVDDTILVETDYPVV
jgi:hypothetical protein